MENKSDTQIIKNKSWPYAVALIIMLYLMYSSIFLIDYLMNDEWAAIGVRTSDIFAAAKHDFFFYGRGLSGLLNPFVFNFVGYDPLRIKFIRYVSFVLFSAIAFFFYRFIATRSGKPRWAFFLVLFLFSQTAIQGVMGYSLFLFAHMLPSIFLSLLAFYLHFYVFEKRKNYKLIQIGIVFLVLLLASQANQTTMFFSVIPLSYLALAEWDNHKKKILTFLAICVSAFLCASIIYKIGINYWHSTGNQGYVLGEQLVETAMNDPLQILKTFINPYTYWSAFRVWSYPYPFTSIAPINEKVKAGIAMGVFLAWLVLMILAIVQDLRKDPENQKKQVIFKWLAVFCCLGLGALSIVLDSPLEIIEHRAHIILTFVGVVIFTGGYGLLIVKSRYRFLENKILSYIGAVIILLIAFGAQSDIQRGIVLPRMENINFIRTELASKNSADYNRIIVILPGSHECTSEPCGPWFGYVVGIDWHLSREGAYRYALSTIGIPPASKSIEFLTEVPDVIPGDSIVVDWVKYIMAREPGKKP